MSFGLATVDTPTDRELSRGSVITRFIDECDAGASGTATSGDTGSVTDTTILRSPQYSVEEYESGWVRISETTDNAAPEGEIRPVSKFLPDEGKAEVDPPFSAGVEAGDKYQIFRFPHPQRLLNFIDTIITDELVLPTWSLLSEANDFDMNAAAATVDTDWDKSNATLDKVSVDTLKRTMTSRRALKVTATSAGGYAASKAGYLKARAGYSYHFSTLCYANDGDTGSFEVWDATHATLIQSIAITNEYSMRATMSVTAPSGCADFQVRFVSTGNGDITYWGDLIFFEHGQHTIALPSWVTERSKVKLVYQLTAAGASGAPNLWLPELHGTVHYGWDVMEEGFGRGQLRLMTRLGSLQTPLYILGLRNEVAFTNDYSDTKHIDAKWMQAHLAFKVYDAMDGWAGAGTQNAAWVKDQLKKWEPRMKHEKTAAAQRVERILAAPEPEINYYRGR